MDTPKAPKTPAWSPLEALDPASLPTVRPRQHKGELSVSAREIWRYFYPERVSSGYSRNFLDWIMHRNRQCLKADPGGGGFLARSTKLDSTGGRPAKDYLLTPHQALALAGWLDSYAALYDALRAGTREIGPAAVRLAGCLKVKEAYGVDELARLLSGRAGFPTGRSGWYERVSRKKWQTDPGESSRASLYRIDGETLAAIRIAVAEALLKDFLAAL